MRQKAFFARTIGSCFCCFLFTIISFAQTEKISENAHIKNNESGKTDAESTLLNISPSFALLPQNNRFARFGKMFPGFPAFSTRRFSDSDSDNFSSRKPFSNFRRGGLLSIISTATGITQISETQTLEKRGLISSNGQRSSSNNFTVDNLSVNLGVSLDETSLSQNIGALPTLTASSGTNSFIPSSQIQELTIKTMSSVKEQRVAGAEINVTSRSGNNTYHGSIFETFGNELFNANDFFANSRGFERPSARLNQFGGSLGGFIRQDRAWFFVGYDGLRLSQPGFALTEVPNFSARQTALPEIRPIFNAFSIQNGQTTSDGFAEFAANFTNPATHDIFGLRIDTQPTDNLRIGGRYSFAGSDAVIRGDKDFSLNTLRSLETNTNSLSAWTTFTPSATVIIDGRINFSRNRIGQRFSLDNFGGAEILTNSPFDFLKYDFGGKNAALGFGNLLETSVDQFQANGAVDWIFGVHQFTFGTDFRRLLPEIGVANSERSLLFAGINQGLNGTASRILEMTRNVSEKPVLNSFSLFAQDSWRISSRFKIDLGLRWDADFAPKIDSQNAVYENSTLQMPNNSSNFAPRFGATFDLFGNGKGIVRGGVGLFFDYRNAAASETFANSFPFASGNFARNSLFNATPTNPLKPLIVFDNDLQTPRTWHVFAEFQQELFRNHIFTATYTASFGRKLFLNRTILNNDSNFNFVRRTETTAESDFSSLQLRFERRFSSGFSFNARYTLSKSKDNFSPDSLRENNFVSEDLAQERGASDFDVRQQLSMYGAFDIPSFFSDGLAKRLTEDWTLSAFANARTAFPVNVGYFRANDFGKEFVRADLNANAPFYLNEETIKRLNPNAFSIPNANRQGTLERNDLRGFPFFQIDARLQKRIRFTNEMRLELAVNAYNVLNKTNFGDMSGNLGTQFSNGNFQPNYYFGTTNSTFGSSNFTPFYLYGGARTIQFSAKFVF